MRLGYVTFFQDYGSDIDTDSIMDASVNHGLPLFMESHDTHAGL
jgi:hypothetical protein